MYETVEIRVKRLSDIKRKWNQIEPLVYRGLTEEQAWELSGKLATGENVWHVRWNWGGCVAGIGQGHYIPGHALTSRQVPADTVALGSRPERYRKS